MKLNIISIVLVLFLSSCKSDISSENQTTDTEKIAPVKEQTILQKVADTYGIEKWHEVNQIDFSFVVIRPDNSEFVRSWSWEPKTDQVTLFVESDTISYARNDITEDVLSTDRNFINDSFWLLFPFHLVWDKIEYEVYENQQSPINKINSTKLKINYPQEGGYTPGDSYEVYLNEEYKIIEWTYHPKGIEEPRLANTFENPDTFNGIMIDMEHANSEIGFQLNFRDVVVK